jgi:hypothetical protein
MRLVGIFVLFALVTVQAQDRRAAATIVPVAEFPLELGIPPGPTAFRVMQRALESARVPYGIEQAPASPETEPVDPARKPDRVTRLDGMTVADALNTIVHNDSRYEWIEVNGRILVRAASVRGASALDARLERFSVYRGSFIGALAALVKAIDPTRPQPAIFRFGLSAHGDSRSEQTTVSKRQSADEGILLTFELPNASVLDILEEIGVAHGQLSWAIQYDDRESGFAHATITMIGEEASAVARSPRASREAARRRE